MRISTYFLILIFCFLIANCNRSSTITKSVESEAETTFEEIESEESLRNMEINKNTISEGEKTNALHHFKLGSEAHNSGNYKEAILQFSKCIELLPPYERAWEFRGMSKFKLGDLPGACSDWVNATALGNATSNELITQYCR